MKKQILMLATGTFLLAGMVACKGKSKESESEKTADTEVKKADETKTSDGGNSAKTYTLSFSPDSVILGKDKEVFLKLLSGEGVELSDPDGKSTGMNLKIKIRATNKSTLDDKKFFNVRYSDSRLELDNGTSITCETGDSLNPEAEASLDGTWEFAVPAGAKPSKLNLFYDGTRVGVAISLK